jgi:hypothetical protein
MFRSCISAILAGVTGLGSVTQTLGQQSCRPTLAFEGVQFSPMQPPRMERKWSAVVLVDASRCAASSTGYFEIVFTRLQETGPDLEVREKFAWRSPSMIVEMDFAADEAVGRYGLDKVTPCPCMVE